MNTRFERNQHPDTHPDFWKEWKPAAAPSLDVVWINETEQQSQRNRSTARNIFIGLGLFFTALIGIPIWAVRHFSKRRAT
jgi:hypothetical protein